jgi:RNA polymerase-associated protein CTR9
LSLLKASIPSHSRTGPGSLDTSERERAENLRVALNCFDATLRSNSRNMMALIGKARVQFSFGNYAEALRIYQDILTRAPHLKDPDPRIGIGCCFWQLGHREDAKVAWERALEVNPQSKHANILLGIYYLQYSSQFPTSDPQFVESYKKGMSHYTQKAFKLDDKMPLASATFGGYFQMRQAWDTVDKLAHKAINFTDVNAIASDGWYLLARKAHQAGEYAKAQECYVKSDQARGGDEKGYLPAKFGAAQIQILLKDTESAKFRLEKLNQQSKTVEAQTLLGTLYAESVFSTKVTSGNKEEIANQRKKAIALFEQVRAAWKDPKKKFNPDLSVLLSLARLYENEAPEKSLQCLKQVEEMETAAIPDELIPSDIEDEAERRQAVRELLPPPLLNNMACFYYSMDKFSDARDFFQTALNACVKARDKESGTDTDALVTTISYNLGRTYEAEGMLDEAQGVYEGLVSRHSNYGDALARLSFIAYQRNPQDGSQEMRDLFERDSENMDVRALYGWFLNRTKKRTLNTNEDPEQKHGKQTLVTFDKYDQYVLTSMGNIWLSMAREMRREEDKERKRKAYERALEFFSVALQHDPHNAYAAQGIAIAVAEDKKDLASAIQILSNVRETMKDATVYMNLGHVFCELKQYSRSIESYELALAKKDRVSELAVLTALGRVWYYKGRAEKDLAALKAALDYSQRVLALSPEQPHFQFNVALVQLHVAQQVASLPTSNRSLEDVDTAAADLDAAIDALAALAKHPSPPAPRPELEQRAAFARTVRNQLERARADQRAWADQNASRLAAAREVRDAELARREEAKRAVERDAEARRAKVQEERARMLERDRVLAEARAEDERRREEAEMTTDSQTGERKKRTRKPRSSAAAGGAGGRRRRAARDGDVVSDGHLSEGEGSGDGASGVSGTERAPKAARPKKRRIVRESKRASKYKSSEIIEDSDEEAGMVDDEVANGGGESHESSVALTPAAVSDDDDEDEQAPVQRRDNRKRARVIQDDDDEDDE